MRILILGGTAFLSAEVARQAVLAGHNVTCLARGSVASPPPGVQWLRRDRTVGDDAYPDGEWDAVVEIARDPSQARGALRALADRTRHWTFVSSCSVYADHSIVGSDEDTALLEPLPATVPFTPERYGEAKVAIELASRELVGAKAHICRAGLIAGQGDASDRYGYWPARFARNEDTVLLPDIPDFPTQVIDVRDLAAWILKAAEQGIVGTFNAVGEVVPFGEYIDEARIQAGPPGDVVVAGEDWLQSHGVEYWSGPDSLPLWLPPNHDGFCARANTAALDAGLTLRPWQETLRDTLADERQRGLDRERKAGLSPLTEARLVGELLASAPAGD
ncbi:epimerase [Arthrobacter sp. ISL-30]|uniref:epimerase n=1 Tax=Arthrobacter sp. ISL-30 TaxID=2819109 RepID=UPI001BEB9942|nr:epimerase [Arthrobacter sp. ISL-30]MBT2513589.1 epimerase [Arthrobacter sp. ISL-30]